MELTKEDYFVSCSSHSFQDGKLFFKISKIDKLPSEEELFSLPPGHIVDGTLKCEIDLKVIPEKSQAIHFFSTINKGSLLYG